MPQIGHSRDNTGLCQLFPYRDLAFPTVHPLNVETPNLGWFIGEPEVCEWDFELGTPPQFINIAFNPPNPFPVAVALGIFIAIIVALDSCWVCGEFITCAVIVMWINEKGNNIRGIDVAASRHPIDDLIGFSIVTSECDVEVMHIVSDAEFCIVSGGIPACGFELNKTATGFCVLPYSIVEYPVNLWGFAHDSVSFNDMFTHAFWVRKQEEWIGNE